MTIPGYSDYQRREFCKSVHCPIQNLLEQQVPGTPVHDQVREVCMGDCIHTTYEFHHWLMENGFLVVKPETC